MLEFDQSEWEGKIVEVHRNLNQAKHNKDLYVWSVLHRGKLIGHTLDISLRDCTFRVSAKGRDRIVRKGQRDVCAWIVGVLSLDVADDCDWKEWFADPREHVLTGGSTKKRAVHFNPFKSPNFLVDGKPVNQADTVSFKPDGCFV